MSGSSSDQESIEFLGVIPSSEPSFSPVKFEQLDTRHSSPPSDYAEEYLQMPILPLSAVAAANATQRADECTNKVIQTYLPSESSNFLDSDGEDNITQPSLQASNPNTAFSLRTVMHNPIWMQDLPVMNFRVTT